MAEKLHAPPTRAQLDDLWRAAVAARNAASGDWPAVERWKELIRAIEACRHMVGNDAEAA